MPDEPPRRSIRDDSFEESNRFKWIESQRVGFDLGERAIHQWIRQHWQGFLRARWIEHLQGKCFWTELNKRDFGLLKREFPDQMPLVETILDQLKTGRENLDVILWASKESIPIDDVTRILQSLDINSVRILASRFDIDPEDEGDTPFIVKG